MKAIRRPQSAPRGLSPRAVAGLAGGTGFAGKVFPNASAFEGRGGRVTGLPSYPEVDLGIHRSPTAASEAEDGVFAKRSLNDAQAQYVPADGMWEMGKGMGNGEWGMRQAERQGLMDTMQRVKAVQKSLSRKELTHSLGELRTWLEQQFNGVFELQRASYDHQIQDTAARMHALSGENASLAQKAGELSGENSILKTRCRELEAEVSEQSDALERLRRRLEDLTAGTKQSREDIKADLADFLAKVMSSRPTSDELQSRLEHALAAVQVSESRVRTLEDACKERQGAVTECEDLRRSVGHVEAQLAGANAALEDAQRTHAAQQEMAQEVEKKLAAAEEKLHFEMASATALRASCAELTERLAATEAERDAALARATESDKCMHRLEVELAAARSEAAAAVGHLQHVNKVLEAELDGARRQLQEHIGKVTEAQEEKGRLVGSLNEKDAMLRAVKDEAHTAQQAGWTLQRDVLDRDKAIAELKAGVGQVAAALGASEGTWAAVMGRIQETQAEVQRAGEERGAAVKEAEKLRSGDVARREEIARLAAELRGANERARRLEREVGEGKEREERHREAVARLREAMVRLRGEVERSKADNGAVRAQFAAYGAERAQFEATLMDAVKVQEALLRRAHADQDHFAQERSVWCKERDELLRSAASVREELRVAREMRDSGVAKVAQRVGMLRNTLGAFRLQVLRYRADWGDEVAGLAQLVGSALRQKEAEVEGLARQGQMLAASLDVEKVQHSQARAVLADMSRDAEGKDRRVRALLAEVEEMERVRDDKVKAEWRLGAVRCGLAECASLVAIVKHRADGVREEVQMHSRGMADLADAALANTTSVAHTSLQLLRTRERDARAAEKGVRAVRGGLGVCRSELGSVKEGLRGLREAAEVWKGEVGAMLREGGEMVARQVRGEADAMREQLIESKGKEAGLVGEVKRWSSEYRKLQDAYAVQARALARLQHDFEDDLLKAIKAALREKESALGDKDATIGELQKDLAAALEAIRGRDRFLARVGQNGKAYEDDWRQLETLIVDAIRSASPPRGLSQQQQQQQQQPPPPRDHAPRPVSAPLRNLSLRNATSVPSSTDVTKQQPAP